MTLQLHRPDGEGGLEPRPAADQDWRNQLRSRRWGTALKGQRLPDLKNTEMAPSSARRSIGLWALLGIATFVGLVVGYGTGFWG
jgi:hypothetical protein